MTVSSLSPRRWTAVAVLLGIGGALTTAFVLHLADAPGWATLGLALLSAAVVASAALVLGLTYGKLGRMHAHALEQERQLTAWINVRPLLGLPPVNMGGWAMDPLFAEQVAKAIFEHRPRLVVECGSGSSTVLIAACLAELGEGRVVSLDHDATYAEKTRRQLALRGLDGQAEVVTAPLVERSVEGRPFRWYDFDAATLPGEVDLLVVDGPPATTGPLARYPLVPLLRDRLSARCVILLDDGDRPDETEIARKWAGSLDAQVSHVKGGKGGWMIGRRPLMCQVHMSLREF